MAWFAPVAACAQTTVNVPEAHLAFVLPAGYQLKTGKALAGMNKQIVFVCQGPKTDGFFTNANLVIQPAPQGVTVSAASALALGSQMKKSLPNYKEVDSGLLNVGGEKAAFHSSTFVVQNHPVHLKQVLLLRGGQMYILSFGSVVPAYSKQVGAFDKMLGSVKWL